jgi:hypothetical protein
MAIPALAPPDNPPLPDKEDEADRVEEAPETLAVVVLTDFVELELLLTLLAEVVVIEDNRGVMLVVIWDSVLVGNEEGTIVLLRLGNCVWQLAFITDSPNGNDVKSENSLQNPASSHFRVFGIP